MSLLLYTSCLQYLKYHIGPLLRSLPCLYSIQLVPSSAFRRTDQNCNEPIFKKCSGIVIEEADKETNQDTNRIFISLEERCHPRRHKFFSIFPKTRDFLVQRRIDTFDSISESPGFSMDFLILNSMNLEVETFFSLPQWVEETTARCMDTS